MSEKLPENLEEALRIIANNEQIALEWGEIHKLSLAGLITAKHGGGWMINSKGKEYLKRYKK